MPSPVSSPRLSRALYRYLLRSCRFGQCPEIFGHYGPIATSSFISDAYLNSKHDSPSSFLPSSSSQVRNILHHAFSSGKDDLSNIDPFAVLRHANETSSILYPSALPHRLPIFDYNSSAAFPQEVLEFNFFEPRYLKLVEIATSTCNDEKGGGYFILRMGKQPRGGASLLKIMKHNCYKDVIGVQCKAGPRIYIKNEESIPVNALSITNNELPPLAVATKFDIWSGEKILPEKFTSLQEKRTHILNLLSNVSDLNKTVNRVGLPPINAIEFSFWALRFVLSENDIASRQRWLFRCNDTEEKSSQWQEHVYRIESEACPLSPTTCQMPDA